MGRVYTAGKILVVFIGVLILSAEINGRTVEAQLFRPTIFRPVSDILNITTVGTLVPLEDISPDPAKAPLTYSDLRAITCSPDFEPRRLPHGDVDMWYDYARTQLRGHSDLDTLLTDLAFDLYDEEAAAGRKDFMIAAASVSSLSSAIQELSYDNALPNHKDCKIIAAYRWQVLFNPKALDLIIDPEDQIVSVFSVRQALQNYLDAEPRSPDIQDRIAQMMPLLDDIERYTYTGLEVLEAASHRDLSVHDFFAERAKLAAVATAEATAMQFSPTAAPNPSPTPLNRKIGPLTYMYGVHSDYLVPLSEISIDPSKAPITYADLVTATCSEDFRVGQGMHGDIDMWYSDARFDIRLDSVLKDLSATLADNLRAIGQVDYNEVDFAIASVGFSLGQLDHDSAEVSDCKTVANYRWQILYNTAPEDWNLQPQEQALSIFTARQKIQKYLAAENRSPEIQSQINKILDLLDISERYAYTGLELVAAAYDRDQRVMDYFAEHPETQAPLTVMTVAPSADNTSLSGTIMSGRKANVRSGPGKSNGIVTSVAPGTSVQVTGRNADGSWLAITVNGTSGWVAQFLVTVEGDVETLPVSG